MAVSHILFSKNAPSLMFDKELFTLLEIKKQSYNYGDQTMDVNMSHTVENINNFALKVYMIWNVLL